MDTTTTTIKEPTKGSLAWFMLRHGTMTPRQKPSRLYFERRLKILPSEIRHLDFDLGDKVYSFAMKFDDVSFTPIPYSRCTEGYRDTRHEAYLKHFVSMTLWRDVNDALWAAQNMPWFFDRIEYHRGESVRIRKVLRDVHIYKGPIIAVINITTDTCLTDNDMLHLRDQNPAEAKLHIQKILAKIFYHCIDGKLTWTALTNGNLSIFIRFDPISRAFEMSKVIPHTAPDIIGYYCYLGYISEHDTIDH